MAKVAIKYRIAIATSDGIVVNTHFGKASSFKIYDIGEDDKSYWVEDRQSHPICHMGDHDELALINSVKNLEDCKYVLVSRIGQGAANLLESQGIKPIELPGMIEESIAQLITYDAVQSLFI